MTFYHQMLIIYLTIFSKMSAIKCIPIDISIFILATQTIVIITFLYLTSYINTFAIALEPSMYIPILLSKIYVYCNL